MNGAASNRRRRFIPTPANARSLGCIISILLFCAACTKVEPFTSESGQLCEEAQAWEIVSNFDRAVVLYDRALQVSPEVADIYVGRATALLRRKKQGDDARARRDLDAALELDPANEGALVERARHFHQLSEDTTALTDVEAALAVAPNSIDALTLRASIRNESGDVSGAEQDLTSAIAIGTGDPDGTLHRDRAAIRFNSGKLADAQEDAEIAVKQSPGSIPFRLLAAKIAENMKEVDLAASHLSFAGVLHFNEGNFKDAYALLEEAVELAPDSSWPCARLGEFLAICPDSSKRDLSRALHYAIHACDVTEYMELAHIATLARVYHLNRDAEKAIHWQGVVVEQMSEFGVMSQGLKELRLYVGGSEETDLVSVCTMVVDRLDPGSEAGLTAIHNVGNALTVAGNVGDARHAFEDTLQSRTNLLGATHPGTMRTREYLARCLQLAGRHDEAAALFNELLATHREMYGAREPKTVAMLEHLTTSLFIAGRHAEVVPQLQELFEYKQQPGITYDGALDRIDAELGHCLLALGNHAEAETHLRRCLAWRLANQPDAWSTFNARSMLGEALALQHEDLIEAEQLAVSGYQGILDRHDYIPVEVRNLRISDAARRVAVILELQGKVDQAAEWRNLTTGQEVKWQDPVETPQALELE